MKKDSLCVKEKHYEQKVMPHQMPIYATSSFQFENVEQSIDIFTGKEKGLVYSRYANPNTSVVADKIAAMEMHGIKGKAYAHLTSSGMSAISVLMMSILKKGDKILTQGNLYGGTTELFVKVFTKMGIETIFTDLISKDKVNSLLNKDKKIKAIYFETPSNPTLDCIDIKKIVKIAKKHQVKTVIDNTFLTPYLQQPFAFGVDFIIHSTTKFLNGHGNSIAGVIIGRDEKLMQQVWQHHKLVGSNVSPFEAWMIANGLKTLAIRMDKHCENAQAVAEYLEQHPKVKKVNYNGLKSHPYHKLAKKQSKGFGGMLSFELKGGYQEAIDMMNRLKFCTVAPTLGDVDTLVLHPASSSHLNIDKKMREQNGITDGLIRISVGIENAQDIIDDLAEAIR